MKRFLLAITFFLTASIAFSHTGIMWGEKDIKYVTTEHFDIIYEPDSADSAALLYENAERILEEVQDFFGAGEIRMRVPVVISSNCQIFNAACGNVPYPLIYLYDTAISENMTVFSNDLLSTFKHELTHAYTLNMKNEFWNVVSSTLGNIYNPANIFVTSGMAESATLSSESSTGEGRLNDEWSLQVTRQAKIEDKFPKFYDEQGLSTKYYSGDYYYFNGGFANYLQETYGMEKYAQFWYKCVNSKSMAKSFKKIYGIKIKKAWKNFEESLFVPEYSEPFEVDGVKDFFSASDEKYSVENNRGAVYTNLSSTEKGLYYLDSKSGNVYFVENEKLNDNKKISPKKIFHKANITGISASSDGRFIAYDYYDSNSTNYKYCAAVYDTKTNQHIVAGERLKIPTVVQQGDDYYLVALNFLSQKKQITIKKIIIEKNKPKRFFDQEYIPLSDGTNILSFTDIGNGKFAMIAKGGMTWELCFGEIGSTDFEKIELPEERMTMRYLSYSQSDNSLYFSWTKPDSMPRLGKFSLNENQFELLDKNISGGVYYPVLSDEKIYYKIYYIGQFTKQNRIFSYTQLQDNSASYKTYAADFEQKDFSEIPSDVITLQNSTGEILGDAQKYNPFRYYLHPAVIPVSSVTSYCFDVRDPYYGDSNPLFLGITTISANPWGKGQLQLSAGIDSILTSYGNTFKSRTYGISVSFTDGTDTDLFNYVVVGSVIGDFLVGFKQGIASGSASFNLDWISVSDTAEFLIGRSNIDRLWITEDTSFDIYIEATLINANKNADKLLLLDNQFDITFGKVQTYESEMFNKIGGLFNVSLFNIFEKSLTGVPFSYNSINLGTSVKFYIPKLLPIKCYDRFVYNLPTVLFASAYTTATEVFSAGVKTTIFGYDIQKGIPFLFFNKIYIDAGYQFAFKYKNYGFAGNFEIANIKNHISSLATNLLPYIDKIFLDINAVITPNIGMVAANFVLTFELFYKPHPLPTENNFGFALGFEASL